MNKYVYTRCWEKYLSKCSRVKHTCSWRVNLLYYEHWTDKYFYVNSCLMTWTLIDAEQFKLQGLYFFWQMLSTSINLTMLSTNSSLQFVGTNCNLWIRVFNSKQSLVMTLKASKVTFWQLEKVFKFSTKVIKNISVNGDDL